MIRHLLWVIHLHSQSSRTMIYKYREFANIIPRRRLSLPAANLFSKLTSPTAWAAARNWKKERELETQKNVLGYIFNSSSIRNYHSNTIVCRFKQEKCLGKWPSIYTSRIHDPIHQNNVSSNLVFVLNVIKKQSLREPKRWGFKK